MIESCLHNGVTPVVTYNHFTVPRWMAGRGGWSADDAPARFADYAARATQHFGDLLSWACTLNEPNLMAMMRSTGVLAMGAGDRSPRPEPVESERGGVGGFDPSALPDGDRGGRPRAHGRRPIDWRCRRSRRRRGPSRRGGPWRSWTSSRRRVARNGGSEARRVAQTDWLAVSADDDFVGVQTYSRARIGPEGQLPVPDGADTMQTGWEVYPEALGHTVRLAAEHAGVPVLVTENGMATDDDAAPARLHPCRARGTGPGRG